MQAFTGVEACSCRSLAKCAELLRESKCTMTTTAARSLCAGFVVAITGACIVLKKQPEPERRALLFAFALLRLGSVLIIFALTVRFWFGL